MKVKYEPECKFEGKPAGRYEKGTLLTDENYRKGIVTDSGVFFLDDQQHSSFGALGEKLFANANINKVVLLF